MPTELRVGTTTAPPSGYTAPPSGKTAPPSG
jgi:hypothetical protein